MIFQGDIKIRTAIRNALEEMRANPWLLDDVFSDLLKDEFLAEYGKKEVENAKEWFLSNKIEVLHKYRVDSQSYPCITIDIGSSYEDRNEATLADTSSCKEHIIPSEIGKKIPPIIKPFIPTSYNNGILVANESLNLVNGSMRLADVDSGEVYTIEAKISEFSIKIKDNPTLTGNKYCVLPQFGYLVALRERASFRESYTIGCHVHGDVNYLIWLHSITLYALLRYRESMFANRQFKISDLKSGPIMEAGNSNPAGERFFVRNIELSGLVQNSWIKQPTRVIENTQLDGLKILSNLDPSQEYGENWETIKDDKLPQSLSKKRKLVRE